MLWHNTWQNAYAFILISPAGLLFFSKAENHVGNGQCSNMKIWGPYFCGKLQQKKKGVDGSPMRTSFVLRLGLRIYLSLTLPFCRRKSEAKRGHRQSRESRAWAWEMELEFQGGHLPLYSLRARHIPQPFWCTGCLSVNPARYSLPHSAAQRKSNSEERAWNILLSTQWLVASM